MFRATLRAAVTQFGCGLFALGGAAAAHAATASFQNGVDGYMGTLDVIIGADSGATSPFLAGDGNVLGSTINEIFLDGRYREISNVADEKQLLIRFDDIFGNGPGQVPLGAKIIDAKFYLTSGETSGDAQSGGPYGVAQLLVPFDASTTFNNFSSGTPTGGATFAGGKIARPMDRGFRGPILRTNADNGIVSNVASVTRAVQNWSNGEANHGLAVIAGTTDGWQIITTGVNGTKISVSSLAPDASRGC